MISSPSFDGTERRVELTEPLVLDASDYTVAWWVKLNPTSNDYLIHSWSPPGDRDQDGESFAIPACEPGLLTVGPEASRPDWIPSGVEATFAVTLSDAWTSVPQETITLDAVDSRASEATVATRDFAPLDPDVLGCFILDGVGQLDLDHIDVTAPSQSPDTTFLDDLDTHVNPYVSDSSGITFIYDAPTHLISAALHWFEYDCCNRLTRYTFSGANTDNQDFGVFATAGSTSNLGHAVEFEFSWGCGTGSSSWSNDVGRQFMIIAASGEIAVFGGRLPFSSSSDDLTDLHAISQGVMRTPSTLGLQVLSGIDYLYFDLNLNPVTATVKCFNQTETHRRFG